MTKHRLKTSPFWAIAVVAALGMGLSACGGGSDGLSAAQQQAVDDAAKIQADKDAAQAAYDKAKMAIAEADTAAAAQAALDDVKDMITGMQIAELQGMVDDRITAIGMADSVTMQKDALMAAADMVDTSDLSAPGAISAANAAIADLQAALDDATDVSDADKAMYQTQLDNAEDAVAMATHRMAIMNAVDMARTYVAGVTDTSTDGEVSSAEQAVQAVRDAIADADGVLSDDDAEIIKATAVLDTIEPNLAAAKTSRTAAMTKANEDRAKENAALGKAMHAALAGLDADSNALANIATSNGVSLAATGLTIIRVQNAGSITETTPPPTDGVMLKAGASTGALSSWNGMDYARSSGTGDDKYVADMARVYTNQDAPKTGDFGDTHTLIDGSITVVTSGNVGSDFDIKDVMADAFTHQGTQTHQAADREDAVYVSGKYDGAPGVYKCVEGCSSTSDGKDSPISLGGTWTFTPDKGAMVSTPDAHYLYYGWWVHKNDKGAPMAASAFAGVVEPTDDPLDTAGNLTAITGSATYVGNAAGKFAIDNVLAGTGSGGHFTADAELNAKFSGTGAGVTGTIDNFRLNDGSEDPGWSVALMNGDLGNDGGMIEPPEAGEDATVWSINGNKAPASGTWNGTMYDEAPGPVAKGTPGDGSNIPTTVTGTFYSEFGSIGRMVGAFGANKQ